MTFARAKTNNRRDRRYPAPQLTTDENNIRRKVLKETVSRWNASNPDNAMKVVSFSRNILKKKQFNVAYISSFVLDRHRDLLGPYFEGTDNDVLFTMHYGFVTTCKLEHLSQTLDLRVKTYEAIERTIKTINRKGMRVVLDELPYPEFHNDDNNKDDITKQTMKKLARDQAIERNDEELTLFKFYSKDAFSKYEFIVVRGTYRTVVSPSNLERTMLATAFLEPCSICGEETSEMKCPFECAKHCVCTNCSDMCRVCPMCRAGRLVFDDTKRWTL